MFDSIRALHRQKTEDKIRNCRAHDLSEWTILSSILTAATLIVGHDILVTTLPLLWDYQLISKIKNSVVLQTARLPIWSCSTIKTQSCELNQKILIPKKNFSVPLRNSSDMLGFKISFAAITLTFVLFSGGIHFQNDDFAYGQFFDDSDTKSIITNSSNFHQILHHQRIPMLPEQYY